MKKQCENPEDGRFVVWPMMLEAHGLLIEILGKKLEARGGPPLAWYDVLVQLAMSPDERLTMKELAESVLLSKSGVTRLVDRMETAGFLERDSCATDRRVVYAKLTRKGRDEFRKAMPQHVNDVEEHFVRHLTDTEARAMRNALAKIIDAARGDGVDEQRVG